VTDDLQQTLLSMRTQLNELDRRQDRNHKEVMSALRGTHDQNGKWHPGIAPRLEELEKRLDAMEARDQNEDTRQQTRSMNLMTGLTLSTAGAAIALIADWLKGMWR